MGRDTSDLGAHARAVRVVASDASRAVVAVPSL